MKPEIEITKIIKNRIKKFPSILVVLGSGWNKVLDKTKISLEIDYKHLFGIQASVPGHEGKLIIGKINGKEIGFMSGRFHPYEGYSSYEVSTPIRIFSALGLKKLILTAACGGLNKKYQVGDFVILNDMITLFLRTSPLTGPKFTDLSQAFDKNLINITKKVALSKKINFHEGIYAYCHGPHYETPADKKALKILGADVVGMSIIPETITARSQNIDILGIGFVTNLAFAKHDHKQVIAQANMAGNKMADLLEGIITQI